MRNHGEHVQIVVDPPKASRFCTHSILVQLAGEVGVSLKKRRSFFPLETFLALVKSVECPASKDDVENGEEIAGNDPADGHNHHSVDVHVEPIDLESSSIVLSDDQSVKVVEDCYEA